MYRLYGALAVLGIAVCLITTGFIINTQTADKVLNELEASYTLAKQGDVEGAKSKIEAAKNEWDKNMETMLLFVSHGRLDQIEASINTAYNYAEQKDISMFLAECSYAKLLTEHFMDVEYPYINNIF